MARCRRDQHGQRAPAGAGARERGRLARGPPLFLLSERQVEQRLRAVVPSASQWKRGVAGESRPFAGVNVLLLGLPAAAAERWLPCGRAQQPAAAAAERGR